MKVTTLPRTYNPYDLPPTIDDQSQEALKQHRARLLTRWKTTSMKAHHSVRDFYQTKSTELQELISNTPAAMHMEDVDQPPGNATPTTPGQATRPNHPTAQTTGLNMPTPTPPSTANYSSDDEDDSLLDHDTDYPTSPVC